MDKRTPRESDTRETSSRKKSWSPPTVLPEPDKKDGWRYRWIRTSTMNTADNTNVSSKFRQGWEPVKAEEHPEITVLRDRNTDFKDNIEVGGLLLCKAPEEMMTERDDYYRQSAQNQMVSVENNFMRENDPRMPLSKPEITTRITFGKGRGQRQ
jgi:hypothetical protein